MKPLGRMIIMLVSVITPIGPRHDLSYFNDSVNIYKNRQEVEWIGVCDGWEPPNYLQRIFSTLIVLPENVGSGVARNRALEHATGEWIYALDYDDIPLENGLSDLLDLTESQGKVWGGARSVNVSDGEISFDPGDWLPWESTIPLDGFFWAKEKLGSYPFLCAGGIIARRDALVDLGGWSREFSYRGQDVGLFAALSYHHEGAYLNKVIHQYRKHPLSVTAVAPDDEMEARIWQGVLARADYSG